MSSKPAKKLTPRLRMASAFAHPYWLLAVSLSGALMAVEYSLASKVGPMEMRISAIAAIIIGLPAMLLTKRMVRGSLPFYAEYSFVISNRAAQRDFWRKNWRNLAANLPLTLALVATWMASRYLRVQWVPMLGMMLILCVLLYPEQEEIHRRIKERVSAI